MGTAGTTKGIRQLLVIAGAFVALAAASASPAQAGDGSLLGCGHEPVHPFLQWLDPLPYTLLPGGDFESGAAGWKLSGGARVVDGNEPFSVTRKSDSHSLLLPQGSSATSPTMCMGLVLPIVRFFSSGGNLLSYLRVEAVYTDASGRQRVARPAPRRPPDPLVVTEPAGAAAARALNALTLNGLTSEIALRFTPRGTLLGSGTWRLDDVYVDPWKVI